MDSRKTELLTKLLKTKTAEFSIKTNGLSQIVSKKSQNNNIIFIESPKNNNINLVISISPIQRIEHMSPKLIRTYSHIVENRGITMTPIFFRLISFKIFVKLDFFTDILLVLFVIVTAVFC